MEADETRLLRPQTLIAGAYRVLRPIAEGGMGMIYEVEQVATGARRALKVMHGQFADDDALRTRYSSTRLTRSSSPSMTCPPTVT